jgi:class 3 adenylate cyclase
VQRAKDYAKTAIARRRSHRYEPLAGNIAIRRRRANRGAELEQALATILFVDIVRSTEKAARLGDSRWTQVMNHYYAAVRRELKSLRGKEVVTTGDAARDVRRAGFRDPLRDGNPRGRAHAGLRDQSGAARRRIQSEWG